MSNLRTQLINMNNLWAEALFFVVLILIVIIFAFNVSRIDSVRTKRNI